MRVLVLGNSNDTGDWIDPTARSTADILAELLTLEFGRPVEVVARNTWPNEKFTAYVERLVSETEPELVYVNVTPVPFSYESVPLRVRRVLGKLGTPIGDAGMRVAGSQRWSHNALFRTVRTWAQALIGGDTHFTCEEVIERYSEAIRRCLRQESIVVAVSGPLGRQMGQAKPSRRARDRQEARRQQVHRALRDLCLRLNVHYEGSDEPYWRVAPAARGTLAGDGMHSNEAGQYRLAYDHSRTITAAWREQFGEPSPHVSETSPPATLRG